MQKPPGQVGHGEKPHHSRKPVEPCCLPRYRPKMVEGRVAVCLRHLVSIGRTTGHLQSFQQNQRFPHFVAFPGPNSPAHFRSGTESARLPSCRAGSSGKKTPLLGLASAPV